MGTNAFTQIIRSPELKVLFDSVETALSVPEDPESFAKSLLLASHSEETVSQIKLLSERLDLKIIENVSGEEDPGTICVFDVDVFFEKDHLQVVKRDPEQWIKTTHLKNESILKVILVHSKSLRVIETKLRVYREYEGLFRSKMVHIQHEYDDFNDIAKKSAIAKAMSIQRTVQSLIQSIPYAELFTIMNEAASKAYSRENIRNICFNEFITDGENVGTVYSDSYVCRFFVTVRRIKAQLVKNTLRSVGKSFASEICKGILHHIESKIQSELRHDLIRLRFDISDDIFATVTVVVLFVIASVINPLFGAAVAVVSLVVTFVFSVDVNSESWRGKVADEIFEAVSKNKYDVLSKLLPMVQKTCIKTTGDLKYVSKNLEEWTQTIKCMELKEMVSLWKQREAIKNIRGLSSCPLVLNLIAGIKDNEPTLKVILRRKDSKDEDKDEYKKTMDFFQKNPGISEKVVFAEVPSTSKKEPTAKKEKEYRWYRIDKNSREKIGKIIKRQAERLYANHSSIVGLGIGNRDSKLPCIIIYCLDKDLIPYGEKPIPKTIEGYPCDIREDIVMFGCPFGCFDCQEIAHPNSGCCIGLPSKCAGTAGFLAKTSGSDREVWGFLTAAHVVAENWRDLYHKKCLLSELDPGMYRHEIVHPLLPNDNNGQYIGKVKESFCGNWVPGQIGIDAAFVENYQQRKAEIRELRLAKESELNYNDHLIVLKRGGATGETFGRLLDCSWFPCIDPPVDDIAWRIGGFYFFESCFGVENMDKQFFKLGDSGSGVFLTENRKPTKPLGIAFAKLGLEPITFVCRIDPFAEAINLRVYEILEGMDVEQS